MDMIRQLWTGDGTLGLASLSMTMNHSGCIFEECHAPCMIIIPCKDLKTVVASTDEANFGQLYPIFLVVVKRCCHIDLSRLYNV